MHFSRSAMKSAGFHHEIHWISWNLLDFMKSTRFHMKSAGFSWWNPPDFMVYHWMLYFSSEPIQIYIMSLLHAKFAVYISPCHEIHQISWNLPDFMAMKSAGFHLAMKSARFHGHEICWISWNLPNFMKSTGFHGHEICRIPPYHEIRWILMVKFGRFHEIRRIPKWAKDPWSYFLCCHTW